MPITNKDWEMSPSTCLYTIVTNWSNTYTNETDRVFKQVTTEAAYCGIILLGTVDATARLISALFMKAVIQILPSDRKRELDEHVVQHLMLCHVVSAGAVGAALNGLKINLTRRPTTDDDVEEMWKIDATQEMGLHLMKYYATNECWISHFDTPPPS